MAQMKNSLLGTKRRKCSPYCWDKKSRNQRYGGNEGPYSFHIIMYFVKTIWALISTISFSMTNVLLTYIHKPKVILISYDKFHPSSQAKTINQMPIRSLPAVLNDLLSNICTASSLLAVIFLQWHFCFLGRAFLVHQRQRSCGHCHIPSSNCQ